MDEQKALADIREKNPDLVEEVEALLASGEGGWIMDEDEIVGFAWPPHSVKEADERSG